MSDRQIPRDPVEAVEFFIQAREAEGQSGEIYDPDEVWDYIRLRLWEQDWQESVRDGALQAQGPKPAGRTAREDGLAGLRRLRDFLAHAIRASGRPPWGTEDIAGESVAVRRLVQYAWEHRPEMALEGVARHVWEESLADVECCHPSAVKSLLQKANKFLGGYGHFLSRKKNHLNFG
jgi:hypothetical protein